MNHSTYKQSGVDIEAGNQFVESLKPLASKTKRAEVLASVGGFSGLFALSPLGLKDPVLVATTDGVGTKLKLAFELQKFKKIGQDLVGMCVNDLICTGAQPLFFLDYFATGKLDRSVALEVLEGITETLTPIHCTLLGGETAEMPGMYPKGEFDIAGFSVGVVERSKIVDGKSIQAGDKIIGLASNGFHSNGFSLIRKIIETKSLNLQKVYPDFSSSLGEMLLAPTQIYVNTVLSLLNEFTLHGIAHITGGGLIENPPRIFPENCRGVIDLNSWSLPPLFNFIRQQGNISQEEMLRVFNCGIGMILIVSEQETSAVLQKIHESGKNGWIIGEIASKDSSQSSMEFVGNL